VGHWSRDIARGDKHESRVAILLNKDAARSVLSWEAISDDNVTTVWRYRNLLINFCSIGSIDPEG